MKKLITASITPLLFLILCFTGCVGKEPNTAMDSSYNDWHARAETSKPFISRNRQKKITQKVARHRTEVKQATAPKIDLPDQLISVRFINDDLVNVMRALGRMANQNILINPSVKGIVNAHIENTPWNIVFTGLVNSYGLVLKEEGNLLRVMTMDDLKMQVEKESLQKEKQELAPLITSIYPIEFAIPEEIIESVKPLLSKDKEGNPRGTVSVDRHSRSLIISDTALNMDSIETLIGSLDKPTPQIHIEAHIVETNQDTARELGVQWSALMDNSIPGGDTFTVTPGGINGKLNADTGIIDYTPGATGQNRGGMGTQGFGVDLPAGALGGFQPGTLGFLYSSGTNLLEVQLSALQRQGKVNILSEPSIVTLDNTEAIIESGRDIPFQTIEDGSVKIAYREASLKLTVTPHVISDTMIKLNIEAKKMRLILPTRSLAILPSLKNRPIPNLSLRMVPRLSLPVFPRNDPQQVIPASLFLRISPVSAGFSKMIQNLQILKRYLFLLPRESYWRMQQPLHRVLQRH